MRSPHFRGLLPALAVSACLIPSVAHAKLIDMGPASDFGNSLPISSDMSAFGAPLADTPMVRLDSFTDLPGSSAGTILGHQPTVSATGVEDHAMVWVKDVRGNYQATDLNEFAPSSSGWTLQAATGVNAQGQIAGIGVKDGVAHKFVLELKAIDCASYAGPLDAQNLKTARQSDALQAVVVAAFQGKRANKYAQQQLAASRVAGLKTGAYCYLNFASTEIASGADQAKVALQACGSEVHNLSFMAVDVETGMKGKSSQARRVKFIGAAVKAIRDAGVQPIIYASNTSTNPAWNALTGWDASFANLPLWTPRYDGSPGLGSDGLKDWLSFGGWSARQGKQYSNESGSEARHLRALLGCGPIDMNVFGVTLFAVKSVG